MIKFDSSKDPDDILDYVVDWTARLAVEDIIVESAFTVVSGDIAVDSYSIDEAQKKTTVWLSGGTEGETAVVLNRIVTAGGRQMDQTCGLKIKSR